MLNKILTFEIKTGCNPVLGWLCLTQLTLIPALGFAAKNACPKLVFEQGFEFQ